ncbi:MAG: nuclear transport factor 2 family protein [Syntrophomonadaceae bacterium]
MKYCYLLIPMLFILSGCAQKKLSEEQLASEKKAVEARIQQMMDGMSKEDMSSLMGLISPAEFLGFGTDSAEVLRNAAEFREQTKNEFVMNDKFEFSKPHILAVSVSDNADLAASLVETPAEVVMHGKPMHMLIRLAQTWRKENGKWMMINLLFQVASTGQSTAELVRKMTEKKM